MRYSLLIVPLCLLCFFSCTDNKVDISKLIAERDSIMEENLRQKDELGELNSFVAVVAGGLDSIAMQEGLLMMSSKGREGMRPDKELIKRNLYDFEELLKRQRRRIAELEDTLNNRGGNFGKLRNIVAVLNEQLEAKERIIAQLRDELNSRNVDLAKLRTKVSALNKDVETLNHKAQVQERALATQTEVINECFLFVGSKKDLERAGLLIGGGLFSKKKLNVSGFTPDKFKRVDIRTFTEITVNSVSPKILTQMPQGSYRIVNNGNGTSILHITNPGQFWSVSNYLIIQTK